MAGAWSMYSLWLSHPWAATNSLSGTSWVSGSYSLSEVDTLAYKATFTAWPPTAPAPGPRMPCR